jgi:hypothetical protein
MLIEDDSEYLSGLSEAETEPVKNSQYQQTKRNEPKKRTKEMVKQTKEMNIEEDNEDEPETEPVVKSSQLNQKKLQFIVQLNKDGSNWETFKQIAFLFCLEHNLWTPKNASTSEIGYPINHTYSNLAMVVNLDPELQKDLHGKTAKEIWTTLESRYKKNHSFALGLQAAEKLLSMKPVNVKSIETFQEFLEKRSRALSDYSRMFKKPLTVEQFDGLTLFHNLPSCLQQFKVRCLETFKDPQDFVHFGYTAKKELEHYLAAGGVILSEKSNMPARINAVGSRGPSNHGRVHPGQNHDVHSLQGKINGCWKCYPCKLCLGSSFCATNHAEGDQRCPTHQINMKVEDALKSKNLSSTKQEVYLDCGAVISVVNNRNSLTNFLDSSSVLVTCDGSEIPSSGIGTLTINNISVDAEYVPQSELNLVAVAQLTDQNLKCEFDNARAVITDSNGQPVIFAERKDNLYRICSTKMNITLSWLELHRIFGHCCLEQLSRIVHMNPNLKITGDKLMVTDCRACIAGKLAEKPLPTSSLHKATMPGQRLCIDICSMGKGIGGYNSFLLMTDEYTKFKWIRYLKPGDSISTPVIGLLKRISTQGKTIQFLRSDNQFRTDALVQYCLLDGIQQEYSVQYSNHVGQVERGNRTICDIERTVRLDAKLDPQYWPESTQYAVDTSNHWIRTDGASPHKLFTGKDAPQIKELHRFGETTWVKINSNDRNKTDPKARELTFIGYGMDQKAYRFLDGDQIITASPHCCRFINKYTTGSPTEHNESINAIDSQDESKYSTRSSTTFPKEMTESVSLIGGESPHKYSTRSKKQINSVISTPNHNDRLETIAQRLQESYFNTLDGPKSYKEAHSSTESHLWRKAEEKEMEILSDMDVYSIVDRRPNVRVIKSKFVYTIKQGEYQARLCAKGFSQEEGIDYFDTFAPVSHYNSIRSGLAITARHGLDIHQMDVSRAFLHADLDCAIYMEPPPCMELNGKILLIKKALYGLKQSPKLWHDMLMNHMMKYDFKKLTADPSVIVKGQIGDPEFIMLLIFVDDILLIGTSSAIAKTREILHSEFKMKDIPIIRKYCGLTIDYDKRNAKLSISQPDYTNKILQWMESIEGSLLPRPLPLSPTHRFPTDPKELVHLSDPRYYQQAVGNLHHLVSSTRLDLAYSTSIVSKYCHSPSMVHWKAVVDIYRYLKATHTYGITYGMKSTLLCGYVDADHPGLGFKTAEFNSNILNLSIEEADTTLYRSQTGYIFTYAGGAISWASKTQKCVTRNSFDAEYQGLATATSRATQHKQFMDELGLPNLPVTMFEDNASVLTTSVAPSTKVLLNVLVAAAFVREHIANNVITLKFMSGSEQPADVLTKAVSGISLKHLLSNVGFNNLKGNINDTHKKVTTKENDHNVGRLQLDKARQQSTRNVQNGGYVKV